MEVRQNLIRNPQTADRHQAFNLSNILKYILSIIEIV